MHVSQQKLNDIIHKNTTQIRQIKMLSFLQIPIHQTLCCIVEESKRQMYLNGIKSILLSNREIHDNCFHLAKVSCLDHDMTAPVNSIC